MAHEEICMIKDPAYYQCKTCKKLQFQPEYFSGLNWRDALPLVGKVVEFSDDPDRYGWESGILHHLDNRGGRRFAMKGGFHYEYIRTTHQTHAHPKINIGSVELPRPETTDLFAGQQYFCVENGKVIGRVWSAHRLDIARLKSGLIHLSESRAQEWADWWRDYVMAAPSTEK
jgi:hypothetical protein